MNPASIAALALATLLAAPLLATTTARAADNPPCPASRLPPMALPHLRDAIGANRQAIIVALGSSSTQGWHASDIAHSYPAILQSTLNATLPGAHIAILNRGVGGEDVAEMLPRIDSDALSVRPTLIIWQIGANGAMRRIAPELFKRLLTTGVRRLRDAKADVVLMNNQRAPAILASPEHIQIDNAIAEVAAATGATLFDRGGLMEQWRDEGFPYDRFVSTDGVHHNDYGYRCIAQALSAAISQGLTATDHDKPVAARH